MTDTVSTGMETTNANPDDLIFDRELMREKDYWTGRLARLSGHADGRLPAAVPPPPTDGTGEVSGDLPEEIRQGLLALTGGNQFLIYTTLMAALKVCLYRHTGNPVVVVASPARLNDGGDGGERQTPNVLAIVDEVGDGLTFRQFLLNVRATLVEAYANQRYPFRLLLEDLGDDDGAQVFSTSLRLKNIHAELPECACDLALTFELMPAGLTWTATFDASRLRPVEVERFVARFLN
ncbi:MAG: condensation domain-containing protein, partial [Pyrinomonadaceae bacterium]